MIKIQNTTKTLKNSIISVVGQIFTILLQFINRRVFIIFLDIEFLGYQTLFNNVFSLLSVAELGIGNIIAFHLYKEIVNNNEQEIGKLMYLYKWLYRIVAIIVLVVGVICNAFLPYFVTDAHVSWSYLRLIYFLQLASVVIGYFLSYRRTILIASQQEYRCVQIDLFANIVTQVFQLALLAIFKNYIVYLCLQLSTTIFANCLIAIKTNKEYPYLKAKYSISKEYISSKNMFKDMRDFIVHKLCYAVYGGTDNIVISAFCGVRNVALYGNYALVQRGVMQILFYKLLNPIQATLGNIVYSDRKKEDLWKQFKMLDVFSFFFATYIGIGFLVFFQPFIEMWMGKEYLLSNSFVFLFAITIYFSAVFEIVYKYRTVFGDYNQDRNMMILSAILNLLISILGAKQFGILGIQFGTLVAFFPIAYGRIRFVVKGYFKESMWKYIIKHMLLAVVVMVEGALCWIICEKIPVSLLGFLGRGIIWFIIPGIINTLLYMKNPSFKLMLKYFNEILKSIGNKLNIF